MPTTLADAVVQTVSRTRVARRYAQRTSADSSIGRMEKWPASGSRSRPRIDWPSQRGLHIQMTDPPFVTSAEVPQSDRKACSRIGTSLTPHIPARRQPAVLLA